jgi:hypothetical protein
MAIQASVEIKWVDLRRPSGDQGIGAADGCDKNGRLYSTAQSKVTVCFWFILIIIISAIRP